MSRYQTLMEQVIRRNPVSIMEIGTWNGKTAQKMIRKSRAKYYIGFDLFEDFKESTEENCPKEPAKFAEVQTRLNRTQARVFLIKGNTKETLPEFQWGLGPIDFIFVDGGHSLETIESDWLNIQKFIGPKTVVILDDYYPEDETKGCKVLFDTLLEANWKKELLEPIDVFPETKTVVQLAKIQPI